MRMRLLTALSLAGIAGWCGACSETPQPATSEPPPAATTEPAPAAPPATLNPPTDTAILPDPSPGPAAVHATMRVTDLDGRPLPGMAPIATETANAFHQPVATGPLTGADGMTRFAFPGDQHLYLRAWDPKMEYFANNFYDALPDEGALTETLDIVMVQGARLAVQLYGPDKSPIANDTVSIMMVHPSQGPWWPSQARTDPNGQAMFERIPAGEFTIEWHVEPGLRGEVPQVALRPGGVKHLGELTLQQEAGS